MDEIFIQESGGGELRAVRSVPYDAEEVLQVLLEEHPDLLGGGQIHPDDPPRWLLVGREVGVPDDADSADRWSLDHLFVDQHGVPTLVEVKRSTDTRIRREVVGQMLDYAANALRYWRVERLRELLVDRLQRVEEADAAILELVDRAQDVEGFWTTVDSNLRRGRVRLVFVADHIPAELQRIVEYLNEQLRDAEALAVEVGRYEGGGLRAFVPRVIGQTGAAQAQRKRSPSDTRSYQERLDAASDEFRQCLVLLEGWASQHGLLVDNTKAYWTISGEGRFPNFLQADPKEEKVWLYLKVLPENAAQAARAGIRKLGGTKNAQTWSGLAASVVIDKWESFTSTALEPIAATIDDEPAE